MSQLYLVADFETRSEADLKKVGAWEYSCHPSTEILCVSWRVGTKEELRKASVHSWSPFLDQRLCSPVRHFIELLLTDEIILVAHNALFEQVITKNVLHKYASGTAAQKLRVISPSRWLCTGALAATHALPRNLEGVGKALDLPIQKDLEGHKLMLKLCKPRKLHKGEKSTGKPVYHNSLSDLRRLIQYCETDVRAETEILLSLSEPIPQERALWELDQVMNLRGFHVDRPLVATALELIDEETRILLAQVKQLTNGEVEKATQRDRVLKWLKARGILLPNLQAKTVADALNTPGLLDENARQLLIARQAASKTSNKKYNAFESRSRFDSRVRDFQVFHAASTGRWGGAGVQPQNFPRGIPISSKVAIEIIKEGADLDTLRLIYGEPLNVLSTCLRGVITATPGCELFCADYAAIEARVLFWLAGHEAGLQAFRDKQDLYKLMAMVIYNRASIEDVTKPEREIGKRAILGLGYGMGRKKFFETCKQFGQDVPVELAERAVNAYRDTHHFVPTLWKNLEKAAIQAVQRPGFRVCVNKTQWFMRDMFLYCQLPSGRRLAYPKPSIRYEENSWGQKMPRLYTWGVNGTTKQWEESAIWGGVACENVTQAVARDLLGAAMLRMQPKGYTLLFSVHDEIVAEREKGTGSLKEFEALMAKIPKWAEGCPINVEGWKDERYRK
jgi:DNA polymerase